MLKFPCLVLDHDDTVVQTEKAIGYPYFRDFLSRIRPGTDLTFSQYVHKCNNMVFADMCRHEWQFTDDELQEEYTGWKACSRRNIPPLCLGIDMVIRKQKELGGIICVASLSTKEIIQRDFLHHFGFLPDAIYDYDLPASQRKPNPFALTDIMDRFNINANDIIVIDDMKLGWEMAKCVGVASGFAGWSKADFPELKKEMAQLCDYSFNSAQELAQFLFG